MTDPEKFPGELPVPEELHEELGLTVIGECISKEREGEGARRKEGEYSKWMRIRVPVRTWIREYEHAEFVRIN